MKTFIKSAALIAVTMTAMPLFAAARGKADFTTFATFGDSFGAGVSDVGLSIKHQPFSWPAIIARQVGLRTDCIGFDAPDCFQIPYISEPGILPEIYIASLSPLSIALRPGLGAPINSGLGRPYNNLSIDGAEIGDFTNIDYDGNEKLDGPIVLRNLGQAADQMLRLNPTFVAMWIGGDDAFNGVQAGDPAAMTPLADFTAAYTAALDKLIAGAPNAGIVIGNLPVDLRGVPFVSTIPPVLVDPSTSKPVINPLTGQPIPLIAELDNGTVGPLPKGSLVLLTALGLLQTGYGIPAQLQPIVDPMHRLPNIGKPIPGSQVLTPTELTAIGTRITQYNAVISQLAAARNIPVVDINAFFSNAKNGIQVGPMSLNLNYITGGLVSLDGFHLTDIGYTLFANEYIKTINASYGTHIPLASVSRFLQNNDPALGTSTQSLPVFDAAAAKAMNFAVPPTAPSRHHVVRH